jgi:crotonobetainyl-CoA:carnitine CoA-transferase CaiB-like acyl-CoA transferase
MKSLSPLAGIKVVDLSRILAGPYCSQILSDQGAEIIKVESPLGDETRRWGPPFDQGMSSYFFGMNRNKKSIVLDLNKKMSQKVLHLLLEKADVLIDNFKKGDLKKFGLSDAIISRKYPRLVHLQISGFRANSSFENYPGFDAAIQAWSGLMSLNGAQQATKVAVPIVDLVTGMNSAFAVTAALFARVTSCRGQKIQTSLLENAFSILHPHASNYFFSHKIPTPAGNTHPNIAPYDLYETKKGAIYIACGNDHQFEKLCTSLGAPQIAFKKEFLTNQLRVQNLKKLEMILQPLLLKFSASRLAQILLENGVPAGPVMTIDKALNNQGDAVQKLGRQKVISSPLHFSRSAKLKLRAPPLLGQHSREILKNLNLSKADIKEVLSQNKKGTQS